MRNYYIYKKLIFIFYLSLKSSFQIKFNHNYCNKILLNIIFLYFSKNLNCRNNIIIEHEYDLHYRFQIERNYDIRLVCNLYFHCKRVINFYWFLSILNYHGNSSNTYFKMGGVLYVKLTLRRLIVGKLCVRFWHLQIFSYDTHSLESCFRI